MNERLVAVAFLITCKAVLAASPSCPAVGQSPASASPEAITGISAGNFSISGSVADTSFGPQTYLLNDPSILGRWLLDFGTGSVWVRSGQETSPMHLTKTRVKREFPIYESEYEGEAGIRVAFSIFAPLALKSETGFLPTLITRMTVTAPAGWSGAVGYELTRKGANLSEDDDAKPWPKKTEVIRTTEVTGAVRGPAMLGVLNEKRDESLAGPTTDGLCASSAVTLGPNESRTITFITGAFDENGYYAPQLPTARAVLTNVAPQIEALQGKLREFIASLPSTGDEDIDRYLRGNTAAAVVFTKGLRTGQVLTMGYRELNQRDSYWTSGIHLIFWPDLDRKMILESAAAVLPSGRMPVTVLPLIDRGDEIDSAEYFVLRVSRHFHWYRDRKLLAQTWPAVQKTIHYLKSMDTEHVGVPRQQSYWADWKDVPGVTGRRYGPGFDLLWAATLTAAAEMAQTLGDEARAADYQHSLEQAQGFINRSSADGGLWNGRNYIERWDDGIHEAYVREDQILGAVFDVIPEERLASIYQQLSRNETQWGVRETFPYVSSWNDDAGGAPGDYHNGGIWPYLNFADALGRYLHGHAEDAERIIHEVGRAESTDSDEVLPVEYINGDTGTRKGAPLQAWDASIFLATYFGALGISRVSPSDIQVHINIPGARDFESRVVLPGCKGTLQRRSGRVSWIEDADDCDRAGFKVHVVQP